MARAAKTATPPAPKGRAGRAAAPSADHGTKDISATLAALDEQGWGDTEEKKFGEVEDGRYQIQFDEATINNSKASGRLQVSWQATVQNTDNKGRKLFWHDGLDDDEQRSWFRGKLARLGVAWPTTAGELPDTLETIKGTFAEVNVKTKDEFQNVNILKAIDSADVEDAPEAEEPETSAEAETVNEASFKDGNLNPKIKERTLKLATKASLEVDNYAKNANKHVDMLLDLADAYKLGPQMWEDPAELMEAITNAAL